jgi:8-oxo-dGTP pyrophosphatase MutT (NUDIX family)
MHKKLAKLLAVGGHIELDETPWEAIVHEISEESGYNISDLTILQPKERITELGGAILHPYPLVINTHHVDDQHLHTDISYGFIAQSDPKESVQEGESLDLRWYTYADLLKLQDHEMSQNAKQAYEFMFKVPLTSWD